MDFRIFDTFTDNLAKLTGEEQKNIKTTLFDLLLNLASPASQINNCKDYAKKNHPILVTA